MKVNRVTIRESVNGQVGKPGERRPAVRPVVSALWRVVRRDLGGFGSVVANNFFLFVATLMWGAGSSGVRPVSAYPFLALLGFLMLFPLAGDPLLKIPAVRLGLWPLGRGQRLVLRAAAVALSPMVWIAAVLAWRVARPAALAMLVLPIAARGLAAPGPKGTPQPLRYVPAWGEAMRKNLRQMLSALDPYLAALITAAALAGRAGSVPGGAAGMAGLAALAMSTCAQCLFSLDGSGGATRYRLMPVAPWRILLQKDEAYLLLLAVLVAPVDAGVGMTFGLVALAVGRYPAVRRRLPVERWRFTSGSIGFGAAQIVLGAAAAFAEAGWGWPVLAGAAAVWVGSVWLGGRWMAAGQGVRK